MTPRTEAGRAWLADARTFAAVPVESWAVDAIRERILAIEGEQDAATRKELAAKVAGLPMIRFTDEQDSGAGDVVYRSDVLALLSEPK